MAQTATHTPGPDLWDSIQGLAYMLRGAEMNGEQNVRCSARMLKVVLEAAEAHHAAKAEAR